MDVVVLTVDQDGSRERPDQVPAALERARRPSPARLAFERTVGDEFQGVLDDPAALVVALERLLRAGAWNIGIGIGAVETPLPDQARAGRGPAYLAAREAVTAAKSSPWRRAAAAGPDRARRRPRPRVGGLAVGGAARRGVRTAGWEVADLVDQGLTYDETASRLGITQSAVSQRAAAAGIAEGRRARELVDVPDPHRPRR